MTILGSYNSKVNVTCVRLCLNTHIITVLLKDNITLAHVLLRDCLLLKVITIEHNYIEFGSSQIHVSYQKSLDLLEHYTLDRTNYKVSKNSVTLSLGSTVVTFPDL